MACPLTVMSFSPTLCKLPQELLTIICGEIDYDSRSSVTAFYQTCKDLRAAAAPIVFHTVSIWNWDTLVETTQAILRSPLTLRYTRRLRVTLMLLRPLPSRSGSESRPHDSFLPKAGDHLRTNSSRYYSARQYGVEQPDTAYMPIARIEGGVHASVATEAAALRDLLLNFDNLNELIFGLGADSAVRPPFETAILHAFGGLQLCNVRKLSIEDTALFWLSICPMADDLTLYLGYQGGAVEWPTAPTVRKLALYHTSCCHAEESGSWGYVPRISEEDEDQVPTNLNRGLAITNVLPNVKVLYLEDCDGTLETVVASLSGFNRLEELRVESSIVGLNVGLESPPRICGTGRRRRLQRMSGEERAAEREREKQQDEIYNTNKRQALGNAKLIALKYFPRLQRFQLRGEICYDFSLFGPRRDKEAVERLRPNPEVDLTYEW